MKIAEFQDVATFTTTFELRGKQLTLRALSSAETQRLERVWLRPQPPLIVKPGSHPEHGPAIPHEQDPRYRQDLTTWYRKARTLEFAAAAGLIGPAGTSYAREMDDKQLRVWAEDVVAAMLDTFTDDELLAGQQAVDAICDPMSAPRLASAAKNSSAHPPAEAVAGGKSRKSTGSRRGTSS